MLTRLFSLLVAMFLLAGCATAVVSGAARSSTADGGQSAADAQLTSQVKTALLRDADVGQFDIRVSTADGVVRLQGAVNGDHAREKAGRVAATVDGVKSVSNELVIEP